MTTLGINIKSTVWIELVATLGLSIGVRYNLQVVADHDIWVTESATEPVELTPYFIVHPKIDKVIFPKEGIGIWVRAEKNANVVNISVSESDPNGVTETNGAYPVNIQDQTSPAIEHYLYQILNVVAVVGAYSIAQNTITFADGHNFTAPVGFANDYIVLMYTDESQPTEALQYRFYQARVVLVNGNDVTFAVPLGFDIVNANIDGAWRVNVNMALVVGDIAAPVKFFTTPVNGVKWDLTRTMIDMISGSAPDDGLFGGGPQLVYGLYFGFESIATNFFEFLVNIQDNGDFRSTAFDVNYTLRSGGQGTYGISTRKSFAGQDKYGVAIRLDGETNDEFVSYVQDNLAAGAQNIDRLRIKVMGHLVTD